MPVLSELLVIIVKSCCTVRCDASTDECKDDPEVDDTDHDGEEEKAADSSGQAEFLVRGERWLVGPKLESAVGTLVLEFLPAILAAGYEATQAQEEDEQPASQLDSGGHYGQALLVTGTFSMGWGTGWALYIIWWVSP